ncbi:MAG: aminoacyltransferase [Anaerolineales bacterium]|nr:aminoacyltransferase [Anaerolineales bacterium]MCX7609617.1 aminoacyltransferase [Anaerolineales bacterium]MDW8226440.1 peptidoglycan bridge formation glycyltransferase FemA/FemB family protein [Anaerolineales bacterium]
MQRFQGSPQAWNDLIASLPLPHLLQTWEWGQVKAHYGWRPMPFIWQGPEGKVEAAALVLRRTLSVGGFSAKISILYVPRGPNLDWTNLALVRRVLGDLAALARRQGDIFIKIDPDVPLGVGIPGQPDARDDAGGRAFQDELLRQKWFFSREQIQYRNTVLIDLTAPEETLLARMKQKTRYNVRLAQRKGVIVRPATEADYPLLYRMYAETSLRDGFPIREEEYYLTVWRTFQRPPASRPTQPVSDVLLAEVDGQPVAGVSVFYFAGQAVYLFGMSSNLHREKMPNYLLQWEAMRRAKAAGCRVYNLWGAPNVFDESDSLWGVFRFKEGFGGYVFRSVGAWDFAAHPLLYRLYAELLPRLMDILRARGRSRTRHLLGA